MRLFLSYTIKRTYNFVPRSLIYVFDMRVMRKWNYYPYVHSTEQYISQDALSVHLEKPSE